MTIEFHPDRELCSRCEGTDGFLRLTGGEYSVLRDVLKHVGERREKGLISMSGAEQIDLTNLIEKVEDGLEEEV